MIEKGGIAAGTAAVLDVLAEEVVVPGKARCIADNIAVAVSGVSDSRPLVQTRTILAYIGFDEMRLGYVRAWRVTAAY
jgi:hypothetical protein